MTEEHTQQQVPEKSDRRRRQSRARFWIGLGAITPLLIAGLGGYIAVATKGSDVKVEMTKLAVNVLNRDPDPTNVNVRRWALDLLKKFSPVPVSKRAADEILAGSLLGGGPTGDFVGPDPIINFSSLHDSIAVDVNLVMDLNKPDVNVWKERMVAPWLLITEYPTGNIRELSGYLLNGDFRRARFMLPTSSLEKNLRIVLKVKTLDSSLDRWPVQELSPLCNRGDGPSLHVHLRLKNDEFRATYWENTGD
jgi:hypothetical protein